MTAPLLPLQSTPVSKSITRVALAKWSIILLITWGVASWIRFSGPQSNPVTHSSLLEDVDSVKTANTPELEGSDIGLSHIKAPGEVKAPVPVTTAAAVKKHTDRVAVIIEDRPLGNLVPVILHFHSVLGPRWPVILYTSPQTGDALLRSAPFSGAVASSQIEIRYLPPNITFASHASVSAFLTSPFLWADLAPYLHILLFQADSILCSASSARVDDFLPYDLVGAPIAARFGSGYNGGLSLRNRELVLAVLARWDFARDGTAENAPREWMFEDQWLFARLKELRDDAEAQGELGLRVNLPDEETAGRFAVETVWRERPLGFHQPHRWQGEHMKEIMAYCPEVGMIAGSTFFG
ncbi:hypothetical protein F5Y19DRAFT_485754 [Xylariaceae sp. FL1651]|nr:hypothetical protein F5Y19DRAFT_485754 [Xylariaceae sp. FL1651]